MRLEKRIQALGSKVLSDPVILYFADGSTKSLTGRRYFSLDLFLAHVVEISVRNRRRNWI
jgi:hypothetical protein